MRLPDHRSDSILYLYHPQMYCTYIVIQNTGGFRIVAVAIPMVGSWFFSEVALVDGKCSMANVYCTYSFSKIMVMVQWKMLTTLVYIWKVTILFEYAPPFSLNHDYGTKVFDRICHVNKSLGYISVWSARLATLKSMWCTLRSRHHLKVSAAVMAKISQIPSPFGVTESEDRWRCQPLSWWFSRVAWSRKMTPEF